ncbi:MAG: hypothetical protein M3227_04295, partial [Thermoproteota archaeon]|nr:hypothetical protein [Thermoproteota archaeon]
MVAILVFIMIDSAYMFNALAQTNETGLGTNRMINIQRTTSSVENVTDDDDGNRMINIQRTTSSVENVTDDDDDDGNTPAQTNASRMINIQRTTSSAENVTDDDDDGNALVMPSIIINNIGGVAIDNFTNIFIANSGNHPILKFDGTGKFITKWGSTGSGDYHFSPVIVERLSIQ